MVQSTAGILSTSNRNEKADNAAFESVRPCEEDPIFVIVRALGELALVRVQLTNVYDPATSCGAEIRRVVAFLPCFQRGPA